MRGIHFERIQTEHTNTRFRRFIARKLNMRDVAQFNDILKPITVTIIVFYFYILPVKHCCIVQRLYSVV